MRLPVTALTLGAASGPLALLTTPLSLWGGFCGATGRIIDPRHPQAGRCLSGCILAMQAGRGSSSSSSALVEAARIGTAPAAILLARADPILVIGSLVAADLYGVAIPVVTLPAEHWANLTDCTTIAIETDQSGSFITVS